MKVARGSAPAAPAAVADQHPEDDLPAGAPVVRCDGVARTFGTGSSAVVAVHAASCTVPRGASIALTGPPGSGKSTLLHLMAGLDRPTAGSVSWPALGTTACGTPALGSRVGVVFQGRSLIPDLDAAENVAVPLLLAGVGTAEAHRRARAALAAVGADRLARSLAEQLSGGQARRVAAARVLAARPALILADEPTGQLDRAAADELVGALLRGAQQLGAALVLATHDTAVGRRLTRQWRMADGALRTDTSPPGGSAPHSLDSISSSRPGPPGPRDPGPRDPGAGGSR